MGRIRKQVKGVECVFCKVIDNGHKIYSGRLKGSVHIKCHDKYLVEVRKCGNIKKEKNLHHGVMKLSERFKVYRTVAGNERQAMDCRIFKNKNEMFVVDGLCDDNIYINIVTKKSDIGRIMFIQAISIIGFEIEGVCNGS